MNGFRMNGNWIEHQLDNESNLVSSGAVRRLRKLLQLDLVLQCDGFSRSHSIDSVKQKFLLPLHLLTYFTLGVNLTPAIKTSRKIIRINIVYQV